MGTTPLELVGSVGFPLLVGMIPCVPLLVYVFRQDDRHRPLVWGLVTGLIAAALGCVAALIASGDSTKPAVGLLWMVFLCGGGWVIGVHDGVALARMTDADAVVRSGARVIALVGEGFVGELEGTFVQATSDPQEALAWAQEHAGCEATVAAVHEARRLIVDARKREPPGPPTVSSTEPDA